MAREKEKKPEPLELTDKERQMLREANQAMEAQKAATDAAGGLPEPIGDNRPASEIVEEILEADEIDRARRNLRAHEDSKRGRLELGPRAPEGDKPSGEGNALSRFLKSVFQREKTD